MRRSPARTAARATRRRAGVVVLLAALASVLVPAALVSAHDDGHGLKRSEPAADSVVAQPPTEVLLEFDDEVVAGRSSVRVISPTGSDLGRNDPIVEGNILRQQVSTDTVDGVHRIVFEVSTRGGGDVQTISETIRYMLTSGGCPGRDGIQSFTSIDAPPFESGSGIITYARPDRTFMDVIYATNGRELHRTVDGGCEWEEILDLGDEGYEKDAKVASITTAAEMPGAMAALVLAPIDADRGIYEASTFFTTRPDQEIRPGGAGLPPLHLDPTQPVGCERPQPCRFAFADALPTGIAPPLYLLAKASPQLGVAQLYRSDDLSTSFTATNPAILEPDVAGGPLFGAVELAPDPNAAGTVYVATGRTVHVSTDNGTSFTTAWTVPANDDGVITHLAAGESVDAQGNPRRDVLTMISQDVAEPQLTQLIPLVPGEGDSLDAGTPLPVGRLGDVRLDTLARGLVPGQILLLPDSDARERPGVWEWERAAGEFRDLDDHEVSPWEHGTSTNPLCTRWFGHDADRLYLVDADDGHDHVHDISDFCVAPDGAGERSSVDVVKFPPSEDELKGDAALQPRNRTVELQPGAAEVLGYRLQRAAEDVPLDIAFLFDTSGSMRDNITQVRAGFQEIVEELTERRVDAWFGLAEFNDLSLRYKRLADIQPPGDEFADALATIRAGGGQNEPHLTALHQLATGEGLDARRGADVKPGQEMNWRPEAVRITILASDEPIYDDPDGPDMPTTLEALNAKDIGVVGLHIRSELAEDGGVDDPVATQELREQMEQLAEGTETYAVSPVDCDGDGTVDIQRGDPIVCTMANDAAVQFGIHVSNAVAGALAELVDAVRNERPFRLEARAPAGFSADVHAAGLTADGAHYPAVDVTRPQNLMFRVTFGCSAGAAGQTVEVPLAALLGELVVAEAAATLVCLAGATAPVVAPPVQSPPTGPLQGAAVAPPPPPPPPAPIPANAPASATSAAASSATATASAQAPAVAAAVAPQTQASTQKAELRTDDDDRTLAFSAMRPQSQADPGPAAVLAGAAMAAAAGALELARRRASASSAQRVSLRRRNRR